MPFDVSENRSNNVRLAIQVVIAIFMAIGAWFANQIWSGQAELARVSEQRFRAITEQMAKLDKESAVAAQNKFTMSDWLHASEAISKETNSFSRRLDKHDDLIASLVEVTKKLEERTR